VKVRKGIPKEKAEKVLKAQGRLTAGERVLSRMKYLSDGAAIGLKGFIQMVYAQYREILGFDYLFVGSESFSIT